MEETKACLFSYALNGSGGAETVDLATLATDDPRLVWIHLNALHPDTKHFLKDILGINPMIVKSLLTEETRPRLEELDQGSLVILRGIRFNPGPEPEDLVSIRLWISGNRIVTLGRRRAHAITEMNNRITHNNAPRRTGEFVAMLCSFLNDGIEPSLSELEDQIDKLEEDSLQTISETMRGELSAVRKQATVFRRHMSPQRDVISRLRLSTQSWMTPLDHWALQDNYDRVTRFVEELDVIRERSQILQDEMYNALSTHLNRNLYVLSIITAIFMPLSFVTGLLGMNVAGIPGAEHPLAFFAVCAGLLIVVGVQIWLFRRMKWL